MENNISEISCRRKKAINSICIFNLNKNWITAQFCACFVPKQEFGCRQMSEPFSIRGNVGRIDSYESKKSIMTIILNFIAVYYNIE
jgi:hypothetical protein